MPVLAANLETWSSGPDLITRCTSSFSLMLTLILLQIAQHFENNGGDQRSFWNNPPNLAKCGHTPVMLHPPCEGAVLVAHSQLAHAIAANKTQHTRYAVYYRVSHALEERCANLGDPFAEFALVGQSAVPLQQARCWHGFMTRSMIKLTMTDALLWAAFAEQLPAAWPDLMVLNCALVGLPVAMPLVKSHAARQNRSMLLIHTFSELRAALQSLIGVVTEPPVVLLEVVGTAQLHMADLDSAIRLGAQVILALPGLQDIASQLELEGVQMVHLAPLKASVQRSFSNHFQLWYGALTPTHAANDGRSERVQQLEAAARSDAASCSTDQSPHLSEPPNAQLSTNPASGCLSSTFLYVRPSRLLRFVLEGQLESFYFISDAAPHMLPLTTALKQWLAPCGTGWEQLRSLKCILIGLMLLLPSRPEIGGKANVNGTELTLDLGMRLPLTLGDLAAGEVLVAALAAVTQPVSKEIPELSTNRFISSGLVPSNCCSTDPKAVDGGSFRVMVSGRLVSRWLAAARIPAGPLHQELKATPTAMWATRTEFEIQASRQVLKSKWSAEHAQVELAVLPPGMEKWCQ